MLWALATLGHQPSADWRKQCLAAMRPRLHQGKPQVGG